MQIILHLLFLIQVQKNTILFVLMSLLNKLSLMTLNHLNTGTIIFWWANKKIWRTQLKNCIIILDKNTIKGGSPYE